MFLKVLLLYLYLVAVPAGPRPVHDPKVREANWVIRPVNPGPMSLLEGKHLLDDGV